MAGKLQFGIHWGKNGFGLVETKDKQILNAAYIPFDTPLGTEDDGTVPEEVKYGALIQKAIQENNIKSRQVNIALSDKDFIFRSFIIPWMQAHEVKNVVDFEATKYIPIPLENLTYAFHAETITDNNQKSLLILFFAAKKDITEGYTQIIENFDMEVIHIEPAPVCLIRVLAKQGMLAKNQSYAIVTINRGEGKIIIIERETVLFVREFPVGDKPGELDSDSSKIFNNIRVSFNFYYRQNPKGKIDKILFIAPQEHPQFTDAVAKEFDKPVVPLMPSKILGREDASVEILNAYGAALIDKSISSKNFELGEKAKSIQKAGEAALQRLQQYKITAGVIAACVFVIFLTNFVSNKIQFNQREKLKKLKSDQGKFESLETSDIEEKTKSISSKLTSYKNIRTESKLSYFLSYIPDILPQGVWLNRFTIEYQNPGKAGESKSMPLIQLEGYAYHRDPNEQYRVINNLIGLLRKDEEFSKMFKTIERDNMSQSKFQNYTVTSFRITCK